MRQGRRPLVNCTGPRPHQQTHTTKVPHILRKNFPRGLCPCVDPEQATFHFCVLFQTLGETAPDAVLVLRFLSMPVSPKPSDSQRLESHSFFNSSRYVVDSFGLVSVATMQSSTATAHTPPLGSSLRPVTCFSVVFVPSRRCPVSPTKPPCCGASVRPWTALRSHATWLQSGLTRRCSDAGSHHLIRPFILVTLKISASTWRF